MKIGVSGASGHLGGTLLSELFTRAEGAEIIGVSRTPENVAAPAQGRFGDYDKPESLSEAYAGLDALVLIPSADVREGVRARQNVAAIDAAVAAGVGHIVLISGTGTRKMPEPHIWAPYFASEQRLMQTAPKWTILRMNYYTEALADEARMSAAAGVPLTGLAENKVAFVSRDDVAAAAAGILTSDGHDGAIYAATGPESLSGEERAAIISEVLGQPVAFMAIPEEHLRGGLAQAGLPQDIVNAVVAIQQGFAMGGFDIVTGDVEKLTGRPPVSFRDALKAALAAS